MFLRNFSTLFGATLGLLLTPNPAPALVLLEGSFLATQDCPAYASKAQRTNPDDTRLVPGRTYPVIAADLPGTPEAYRIEIRGAEPKLRWVEARCGEYPPKSAPAEVAARFVTGSGGAAGTDHCPNPPPSKDPCRACGKSVSNVLALVWLPGRCEATGQSPMLPADCQSLDANSYGARNLTLGELRPVMNHCRKEAGFCGTIDQEAQPYTAYPEITLSDANRKALAQLMPGTLLRTGQERQEWFKHGTCSGLAENLYFSLLVDLARQVNQSEIGEFLARNRGNKVHRDEFFQAVDAALGKDARRHVNIECSEDGKSLTSLLIHLPGTLQPGLELKDVIGKGPSAGPRGNCASRILIPQLGSSAVF